MKEIRETKLVEKTTVKFVAEDGKEFIAIDGRIKEAETECVVYERRLNEKRVDERFEKLHPVTIAMEFVEAFYGDEGCLRLITLKSENDFDAMVDYYALESSYMDLTSLYNNKPTTYPDVLLVASGCEWTYCMDIERAINNLKLSLEKIKEVVKNFNTDKE